MPKGDGSGPLRAPDGQPDSGSGGAQRKLFPKGGLRKPVPKANRLPITIMSVALFGFLIWFAQYWVVTRPAEEREKLAEAAQAQAQQALAANQAAEKERLAAAAKLEAEKITVKVDTNPSGASVTLGKEQKTTPTTFTNVAPGTISLLIHLDGYRDYQQKITGQAGQPLDLGVIALAQKTGSISLTCAEDGLSYTLTGPGDYNHKGNVPDKLPDLPVGAYQLNAKLHEWQLPATTITLHPDENLQQDVKIPYATLTVQSDPPGATVRSGRTIMGQTPVTLEKLHPGAQRLSIDLAPYTVQYLDVNLPGFANVTKSVTLAKDKDFIGASGVQMVWIPEGGFWAQKYLMRQSIFETVARYNPSNFRRANRPVENISWDHAMAFCDLLTDYERKAGKLPAGFKYSLPTESQYSAFAADADIDDAATSRSGSLTSTQDVGYSSPNKYGIYDSIGNVWEWCLDNFDDKGDHSLRGGNWLSSTTDFPDNETRNGAAPTYADRFTGFRVVLVPQ